ncbi:hypothetical protein A3Q56_08703, partial [Intoshia linei]
CHPLSVPESSIIPLNGMEKYKYGSKFNVICNGIVQSIECLNPTNIELNLFRWSHNVTCNGN